MARRVNSATKMNVVETLKRMLLSRNTQEQLKATTFICESLEKFENNPVIYTNLIEHFIVNDICNFLCEASATLQVQLLRNILKCLKIFSTSPIFYKNSCSPQVVTAIVRTIQFLIKENGSETIIDNALRFLSEVFFGINKYEMNPILSKESLFNVLQLFEMLTTILDKINYETETKLTTSLVLHSIIYKRNEDTVNVLTVKALSHATTAIKKCLELLYQLLIDSKYKYSSENQLDCVFGMLCRLSIDSLHFCEMTKLLQLQCKRYLCPDDEKDEKMNKEIIEQTVFRTLTKVVTQVKNFEPMILIPNNDVFLELLNEFLHKQMPQETLQTFAQQLCSNGFLSFLGRLIPSSNKTKKLCLLNLGELLSIMSSINLNLSTWTGGEQNFRRHIFEGLFESGTNLNKWPQKLSDVYASDATIHSLIVFLYFNCLNSPSPENIAAPLLPYLVEYIVNLQDKKCPDPITKCLWLIFAIAHLYNTGYSSIEGGILKLQKAVSIMAKLVLLRIKITYTHHAAILLWVFSSHRIQHPIRHQLVLWLRTESTVPDSLTSVPELWYSLLEVITQSSEQNSIRVSTNLLKYCIEKHSPEEDDIKHVLWETLPVTLSALAAGNTYICAESVLCLLELCSTCTPGTPSLRTIQRTASLLPTVVTIFKKKNIDVQFHFVIEAYCLLVASLKQEDKQVLSQFISSPPFLQLMYDATQSSNIHLSKTALQLLSLSTFYRAKHNLTCEHFVKLDATSLIVSLRDEKENDKTFAILQLLYTIFTLEVSNVRSFVILSTIYPVEKYISTCRALFFRLQMVCCKDSKKESESAWQCLNMMLKSAAGNQSELINVLTSQPWTHKLIAFYLYQNHPTKCHKKFLKFVFNWLTCYKIITGKEKIFHTNKKEMFPVYKKNNLLFSTLATLVNTFSQEEVQVGLNGERMNIVTNILNLISYFLE